MRQDGMELARDKRFLRTIRDDQYTLPTNIDHYGFARALIENFSSPDGELRDELSYMILANGIIDKRLLSLEQLQQLLTLCMDQQHLYYRIGEIGTDAIFMRSFSVLAINTILYTDAKEPELPRHLLLQTTASLLHYAQQERDWRAYIQGKGWAQAMAHLADALDECAQNQHTLREDRQEILETIRLLAMLPEPLYHEEDVRLARVVYHIIVCKQLDEEYLSRWLDSCRVERGADVASWTSVTNMKNFLRSLYFLLLWENMAVGLIEQVSGILKQQDDLYVEQ